MVESKEQSLPPSSERTTAPRVMDHLSVRDLEMMPKLDQIRRMKDISVGGTTNINDEVVAAIAGLATREVDGVAEVGGTSLARTLSERVGGAQRRARGVEVEVRTKEAILDLTIRVYYGNSIPTVVTGIRHKVAGSLLNMCGLIAKEVNIKVTGLAFPERMQGRVE